MLDGHFDPGGLAQVLLMLGVIWWMNSAYAGVIVAFLAGWVTDAGGVRPVLRAWRAGQTPSMHSG